MSKQTDAAYAAGILDGEGSISMTRCGGTKHKGTYWRVTVSVSSCDEVLIDWLVERYGGATLRGMDRGPTRRLQCRWQVVGVKAREFLKATEPYLVIKGARARKAEEVFQIQSEKRGNGNFYSDEQRTRLLTIREWFDAEKQTRSAAERGKSHE